ncbi:NAC domain-containing protein 19-like isoform X2 [Momordica charantia]|uniref:NAC domain-containing protein 19-like isoform X2 n=1 Tax=Momordica charantia TaxID=3673 RepID=A0A6J1CPF8_MOMCH|nr:NAC domain-containing protein 19-like isoform X2 [Momordica charantia]
MEDPQLFTAPSFSLPPGCRFFPSDEQLLRSYLSNKTSATIFPNSPHNGASAACNLIKELDPFDYDPFDLPDFACFSYGSSGRKKHWYYYTATAFRENRGGRIRMKSGYWKRKGRVREVIGHRGIVLGIKRSFVFYLGNSIKNAVKTNWIVYEYALGDHLKASLVLHRVFLSSRGNSILENGLSSYGEGSVSEVCHNQRDGIGATNMVDAEACEGDILNTVNGHTRYEMGLGQAMKPNCQVITDPDSATTTLQVPSEAYPCEMTTPSHVIPTGSMSAHVIDKQQLISILERDYLELDDLVD